MAEEVADRLVTYDQDICPASLQNHLKHDNLRGMPSTGMRCHLNLVRTDVSEVSPSSFGCKE
jgi:hypothetical protein